MKRFKGEEELLDRSEVVFERYGKRDEIVRGVEPYYYDVGVVSEADSQLYNVRVPEGQYALDLIADLLSVQGIKVVVPAHSESQKDRKAAEGIEAWLGAWLEGMKLREDVDLVHELGFDAALRGACVVRVLTLAERLPKKRERKGGLEPLGKVFPMTIDVRDWLNVYPVYRRSQLVEVFERYEVSVFDLRNDEVGMEIPEEWEDDDQVQVCEWWTAKEKAFWVQGKSYGYGGVGKDASMAGRGVVWMVKPMEHGLGCMPYVVRFARGQSKNRANPERMAPSLLQSWRGTLDGLGLAESAKFTAAMGYINSAWVVYSKDVDFELDLTHGAVNYLRPDEKVEPIVKATMPIDLGAVASEWQQRFQRASVPTALYGENIGPNMAGYAIALLSESGRRILLPITSAVESTIEAACFVALMQMKYLTGPLLENLGYSTELAKVRQASSGEGKIAEPVRLKYEDIPDHILLSVNLGDPLPQDKERKIGMALQLRQPGPTGRPLLSDETIRADLGVENNLVEDFRIEREKLMSAMADTIAVQVAQEEGQIGPDAPELTEEAMMAQEEQAQGVPDQGQMMQLMQVLIQKVAQLEQQIGGGAPVEQSPGGGLPAPVLEAPPSIETPVMAGEAGAPPPLLPPGELEAPMMGEV